MTDAGSVDLLITTHGTCETRECAAATTVENIQGVPIFESVFPLSALADRDISEGEMGGGTYTYLTLPGMFNHPDHSSYDF